MNALLPLQIVETLKQRYANVPAQPSEQTVQLHRHSPRRVAESARPHHQAYSTWPQRPSPDHRPPPHRRWSDRNPSPHSSSERQLVTFTLRTLHNNSFLWWCCCESLRPAQRLAQTRYVFSSRCKYCSRQHTKKMSLEGNPGLGRQHAVDHTAIEKDNQESDQQTF